MSRLKLYWTVLLGVILLLFLPFHLIAQVCSSSAADKVTLKHAKGFSIEYLEGAKVIKVLNPWKNAGKDFTYLLVSRGCQKPEGIRADQVITIPVQRMISLSTTNLPFLDDLKLVPRLVGIDDGRLVNNPAVRKALAQQKIKEVGWASSLDFEKLLSLKPDLVLTYGVGQSGMDNLNRLKRFQIPFVVNGDYLEPSPLGRAEWIKFIAAFTNSEQLAAQRFSGIERRYLSLVAEARKFERKPTVFTGSEYRGIWRVPGGQSYLAALLRDAGARYIWRSNQERGGLPLDFEAVYAKAWKADFWLNPGMFRSIEDLTKENGLYREFLALKGGRVFNNNAKSNENGGNDYWESGLANPDLLLADLIRIFHPTANPEHQLIWYQQLK